MLRLLPDMAPLRRSWELGKPLTAAIYVALGAAAWALRGSVVSTDAATPWVLTLLAAATSLECLVSALCAWLGVLRPRSVAAIGPIALFGLLLTTARLAA